MTKTPKLNYIMGNLYLSTDKGDKNFFTAKKWGKDKKYLLIDLFSIDSKGFLMIQLNRKWEWFNDNKTVEYKGSYENLIHKVVAKIFTKKLISFSHRDNRRILSNGISI